MGTICNLRYQGWTRDWGLWTRPVGRLLVLLTTVLVLVMPVTEHLCNWDHFLRGGQDVEFNLLAALLFAAMVVLSMSGRMIRPPMMQPATAATIGSCGDAIAGALARQKSSSRAGASAASRSPRLDGADSISGSRMPRPLRI
ncbi:MAG TPA: hypothetical protein VE218_07210 [Acidobacteriaceae bacterium]|nr:hypothetical protein [Acidobacteriaceae bacterium]